MDKDYEKKYHSNEEKNWWFISRRSAILNLFSSYNRKLKILDIGCAGGPLLLELKNQGFENIYGLDFSPEAIALCKERGLDNVFLMDGHCPQFEIDFFDIIISSDSLEHLKEDEVALANWFTLLKPNGELFIFVPAFMFLWGEHDVVNHHFRRYTKSLLKERVQRAGFKVLRSGFWNFSMFFPTSLYRILKRLIKGSRENSSPKDQLESFNPFVNSFLIGWLKLENIVFTKIGLPIGVSTFIQAQKK